MGSSFDAALWTTSARRAAGDWVSSLLPLTVCMIITPGSPRFPSVKWGCICS